ncbi:hypothetical protein [Brevundimonas goettingensis]|uniref:Uncharacterized protein n=1 Tax=Brevundimonas goettingensis TaxID=2774190 RepID=A0A975GXD0_9CAUL|nr:hypothetical protein [Brevundimonas goettingensis]QTC92798.1 hypothetical protein IFJ75_08100 [Brevundimonas goettingensis]
MALDLAAGREPPFGRAARRGDLVRRRPMNAGRRSTVLERAFELADSGKLSSIRPLRRMLLDEGFAFADIASNLGGLGIRRALKARIDASRARVSG